MSTKHLSPVKYNGVQMLSWKGNCWMQYTKGINLSVFSLVILLLIYFNVRHPLQKKLPQNHVFSLIVFYAGLVIFLDILSVLSNGQPGMLSFFMNKTFNLILLSLDIIPPMLWLVYVYLQIYQDMNYARRLKRPLAALFILNVLLCTISLSTGWIFYLDAANVFHRSPLYWVNLGLGYFLIFYSVAVVVNNRKNMKKKLCQALVVFMIPVTIGGLFQFVYSGGALTWAGITLSILTVYFNIQNKSLNTDYLTGLHNRRQLDHYMMQKIKDSNEKRSFSAILMDLDEFKHINDTFGHFVGDQVLQATASLIRVSVRTDDFVARYGGDEFCIILDTDDISLVEKVERRIQSNLEKFNRSNKEAYPISLSIGYGVYDAGSQQSYEEFMAYIDSLMYRN